MARSCGVSNVLSRPAPFDDILRAVQEELRSEPPAVTVPPRGEFTLDLLRLLTSTLSQNFRSVIPALAEVIEHDEEPLPAERGPDARETDAEAPRRPDGDAGSAAVKAG